MAYREVTILEIKEVLRLWQAGVAKKRIAAQLGVDPKTVRRYLQLAVGLGIAIADELTDDRVSAVVAAAKTLPARTRGDAWAACVVGGTRVRAHEARRRRAPQQGVATASRSRRASAVLDAAPLRDDRARPLPAIDASVAVVAAVAAAREDDDADRETELAGDDAVHEPRDKLSPLGKTDPPALA